MQPNNVQLKKTVFMVISFKESDTLSLGLPSTPWRGLFVKMGNSFDGLGWPLLRLEAHRDLT